MHDVYTELTSYGVLRFELFQRFTRATNRTIENRIRYKVHSIIILHTHTNIYKYIYIYIIELYFFRFFDNLIRYALSNNYSSNTRRETFTHLYTVKAAVTGERRKIEETSLIKR